jgi:hypothetical protein
VQAKSSLLKRGRRVGRRRRWIKCTDSEFTFHKGEETVRRERQQWEGEGESGG